jgi:hypothetical protein
MIWLTSIELDDQPGHEPLGQDLEVPGSLTYLLRFNTRHLAPQRTHMRWALLTLFS